MNLRSAAEDYRRIEKAIIFLEKNFQEQPRLKEIACSVNLSEYHFQRVFTRWAGLSPKKFLQFLTIDYAKKLLNTSRSLVEVAYESGLSAPSRLHDLFVTFEAITPGEFKRKGEGLVIRYGFHATLFGGCMIAITDRGICGLNFCTTPSRKRAINDLQKKWRNAVLVKDPAATGPVVDRIFPGRKERSGSPLKLLLLGTNFQIKVWEALLRIPAGTLVSYEQLAVLIGRPAASRAVGSALARSPIGYLIPCHRVIRKIGVISDYQWGTARKKAMLGWEAAQFVRAT